MLWCKRLYVHACTLYIQRQ